VAAGAREVAVPASASEPSSERDLGCSIEDRLHRLRTIVRRARREGCRVRGQVSMVAGCPYQGEVPPEDVVRVTSELFELGCDEVSLGDTIGVGTPLKARRMVERVAEEVPVDRLAAHFHDTYGQGLANTLAAFEAGVSTADTSAGGLGGGPFPAAAAGAAGVAGNLATEDLLYALEGSGVVTGVDLEEVIGVTAWMAGQLSRPPLSRVARAVLARGDAR
ncbi:MAG: hydroxymethylglutaryl-CoA lyase, partial [Gammaproteobacteria bacterium]